MKDNGAWWHRQWADDLQCDWARRSGRHVSAHSGENRRIGRSENLESVGSTVRLGGRGGTINASRPKDSDDKMKAMWRIQMGR